MSHRQIFGLQWARLAQNGNPWPKSRATGSKAQGLKYEKMVGKALPHARANVWVEFCDRNGPGFCCPDFVLKIDGQIVLLECKLTDCAEGYTQLSQLYLPVFEMLCPNQTISGIVVCKNLTRKSKPMASTITEALQTGRAIHWLGHHPILGDLTLA